MLAILVQKFHDPWSIHGENRIKGLHIKLYSITNDIFLKNSITMTYSSMKA